MAVYTAEHPPHANRLCEEIMVLLDHPERRRELADAARQHSRPHAAAAVASAIIDAAGRRRS
jgi:UDP-N-acetylglucosamine--N-acetylmuramyl-(pentapeptide) pyrophosphoryl-undecaprenol N-acetylglucosamine transferase